MKSKADVLLISQSHSGMFSDVAEFSLIVKIFADISF